MTTIRPAAVAGTFYPDQPHALAATVGRLLAEAPPAAGPVPKALIAPHAGYAFSGPTAAAAYARLAPLKDKVRRVVLLGPVHRFPIRGLALSSADAWATPLGPVPLDRAAADAIRDLPQVSVEDRAHATDHALEVHLPFLRAVLGEGFALLPLAVGDTRPEDVAEVLDRLWGGPETVIVVSSDLSHFHDYETCRRIDARTVQAIQALRYDTLDVGDACGRLPIAGLLTVAREKGLSIQTVDVRNSGDTAGPRDRVVGYGAWALYPPQGQVDADPTDALLAEHGETLLGLAVRSIRHGLTHDAPPSVPLTALPAALQGLGASFVTLTIAGALRGCIGSAVAWRPVGVDLIDNAWKAAFADPRFPRLQAEEVSGLGVSVSLLTPPVAMAFRDEADLLSQLRPGRDGVILEDAGHRGLFLPAVWEQLAEPAVFLAHLKRKAGLSPCHWSSNARVWRFETKGIKGTVGHDGVVVE